ncbi:hypothetical protein NE237_009184 [Protea cynaroides]|uniref:Uncharacterized protein n=1 Tax=Protea cynaroides TaxID=273540 RepID=A0A9Q0R0E0_9MAGN|nr:hypothetical protein NE237_009184 [Protea cynaroides]
MASRVGLPLAGATLSISSQGRRGDEKEVRAGRGVGRVGGKAIDGGKGGKGMSGSMIRGLWLAIQCQKGPCRKPTSHTSHGRGGGSGKGWGVRRRQFLKYSLHDAFPFTCQY